MQRRKPDVQQLKYTEDLGGFGTSNPSSTTYLQFGIADISLPTGRLICDGGIHGGICSSQMISQAGHVLATLTYSQAEEN